MCIFCDIANRKMETQIVYEDELVMAFLDHEPINEGHILLIPKKHYLDVEELPKETLHHLMDISQKLVTAIKKEYRPDGYSIMQNGGAFNDIGHYHLHIFPRYSNDGFGWNSSEKQFEHSQNAADAIRDAML
ncbi:MAG: HIT family protein [Lachnospiraceae bacterium]|nr:HIT family protein [Lachnospiraceae bacterium]